MNSIISKKRFYFFISKMVLIIFQAGLKDIFYDAILTALNSKNKIPKKQEPVKPGVKVNFKK